MTEDRIMIVLFKTLSVDKDRVSIHACHCYDRKSAEIHYCIKK